MNHSVTHPDILKRLRRAEGHLRTILTMVEQGRGCLEVAQQLHAVEKAIAAAKKKLIHEHIDSCLLLSLGDQEQEKPAWLAELQEITKHL